MVDRLVPDPVLIHSFAQMGLSAELRALRRDLRPTGAATSGARPPRTVQLRSRTPGPVSRAH